MMTLNFTFLKQDQIWRDDALDVMREEHWDSLASRTRMAASTDLTTILGGYVSHLHDGYLSCAFWTTSSDGFRSVNTVDTSGELSWCTVRDRVVSARPALAPSEASKISLQNIHEGVKGVQIGEYGEYPQTVADERTSEKLERLLESRSLRPTGKNYTFDSVGLRDYRTPFKATSYQEYEMDGKRYIRLHGRPADKNSTLSTGEQVWRSDAYWIEVQPIEWLMDRSGWMVAKKCLFAGIQFDTKEKYDGDFSKTSMKHYLDTYFAKEIESSKTIERTKAKKGLTALLSEQERKEIEDDEDVVLFRESRKALIEKKLRGTEKLGTKEKRKAEIAILRKTNVQALRDAEGKARAKKMASILKKKQKTK